MSPRHWEGGFALPLTLFVVAMVTIILSAALVEVGVDRRIAESAADQMDVMAIAQSGLQTYLATPTFDACYRAVRPVDGDSVRINVTGGYADVVARVVQKPKGDTLTPWTYVVRSTGLAIHPTLGADPQAERTVAEFAGWNRAWMEPLAAFVAANGLTRYPSTGTGQLTWQDQAPACRTAVAPLRVAGSVPDLTGYDLASGTPVGGYSSLGLANATDIDWAATIGSGLVPDYTYVQTSDTTYPSMRIVGNATLGAAGATTYGWGLLIVTGDLDVVGSYVQWYGVVLVGGKIDFHASSQYFDGTVVSGLNAQLGSPVSQGHIGGGYIDMDYDSRYVRLALASLAGFGPMSNTWLENWASY